MGHADDLMGEILIFCIYFVFLNFSNKYSAHFAFHIRSSFLDCLWISLLSFLRPFVSLVSFLYNSKSFNFNEWPGLLIPFGHWRRDPLGSAASTAIFPRSRKLVGGQSCMSFCRWEWYASAFLDSARIGFHPLNDGFVTFQASIDLLYEMEAKTLRWSEPKSKSIFADTVDDCEDLEWRM